MLSKTARKRTKRKNVSRIETFNKIDQEIINKHNITLHIKHHIMPPQLM